MARVGSVYATLELIDKASAQLDAFAAKASTLEGRTFRAGGIEGGLSRIGEAAQSLSDKMDRFFIEPLNRASHQLERWGATLAVGGQRLITFGAYVSAFTTAPIIGGFVKAAETAINFDTVMRRLSGTLDVSTDMADALRAAMFDMAHQVGLDLDQVTDATQGWAEAVGETVRSQADLTRITKSLLPVLQLAALRNVDIETAMSGVVDVMTTFGLRVTDTDTIVAILNATADKTTATMEDLFSAFSFGADIMDVLGIPLEEVSATLGILADSGIEASRAGRGLQRILSGILDPSTKAEEALNRLTGANVDLGQSYRDLVFPEGEFIGLGNLVTLIAQNTQGWTNAQLAQNLAMATTEQATRTILPLLDVERRALDDTGTSINVVAAETKILQGIIDEQVLAYLDWIEATTGVTRATESATETWDRLWATFHDRWDQRIKSILATLMEFAVIVGEQILKVVVPPLETMAQKLAQLAERVREMDPDRVRDFVQALLGIAAIGPATILLGTLVFALGNLISAIAFLVSPVGLAALGLGIQILGPVFEDFIDLIKRTGGGFEGLIKLVVGLAIELGLLSETEAITLLQDLGIELADTEKDLQGVRDAAREFLDSLQKLQEQMERWLQTLQRVVAFIAEHEEIIKLTALLIGISELIALLGPLISLLAGVVGVLATPVGLIAALAAGAVTLGAYIAGVRDAETASLAFKGAVSILHDVVEIIKGTFDAWTGAGYKLGQELRELWDILDDLEGAWHDAWYEMGSAFRDFIQPVIDKWNEFWDGLPEPIRRGLEAAIAVMVPELQVLRDHFPGSPAKLGPLQKGILWEKWIQGDIDDATANLTVKFHQLADDVAQTVDGMGTRVRDSLRDNIVESLANVVIAFENAADRVGEIVDYLQTNIGENFELMKVAVGDFVFRMMNAFGELRGVFDDFLPALDKLIERIEQLMQPIDWQAILTETLGGALQDLLDMFRDALDRLFEMLPIVGAPGAAPGPAPGAPGEAPTAPRFGIPRGEAPADIRLRGPWGYIVVDPITGDYRFVPAPGFVPTPVFAPELRPGFEYSPGRFAPERGGGVPVHATGGGLGGGGTLRIEVVGALNIDGSRVELTDAARLAVAEFTLRQLARA